MKELERELGLQSVGFPEECVRRMEAPRDDGREVPVVPQQLPAVVPQQLPAVNSVLSYVYRTLQRPPTTEHSEVLRWDAVGADDFVICDIDRFLQLFAAEHTGSAKLQTANALKRHFQGLDFTARGPKHVAGKQLIGFTHNKGHFKKNEPERLAEIVKFPTTQQREIIEKLEDVTEEVKDLKRVLDVKVDRTALEIKQAIAELSQLVSKKGRKRKRAEQGGNAEGDGGAATGENDSDVHHGIADTLISMAQGVQQAVMDPREVEH